MVRSGLVAALATILVAGGALGQGVVPSNAAPNAAAPANAGPALGNAAAPAFLNSAPPAQPPSSAASTWHPIGSGPSPFTGGPVASPAACQKQQCSPAAQWGYVDFLLGWMKGDPLPFLVTTAPAGADRTTAGILGQTGTTALLGGRMVNNTARIGVRVGGGTWLDNDMKHGLEASAFWLTNATFNFGASSDGSTILARPFNDTTTGRPSSSLVAFPGSSAGSIRAVESSRALYGFNVDYRENFFQRSWARLDALAGYRFLTHSEKLQIQQTTIPTSGVFVPGTTIGADDQFTTRNTFNGLDLGGRVEFAYDALSLEVVGKVAVGYLNRHSNINGSQVVSVPGTPSVFRRGGFLALGSNIGSRESHDWTGVPELAVNLTWQVNENFALRVGYWSLWWLNIGRPSNLLDTTINPNQIPPSTVSSVGQRPFPNLRPQSDIYINGLTLGAEFRF